MVKTRPKHGTLSGEVNAERKCSRTLVNKPTAQKPVRRWPAGNRRFALLSKQIEWKGNWPDSTSYEVVPLWSAAFYTGGAAQNSSPGPRRTMSITLPEFVAKWRASKLTERSAAQQHFLDLCEI